jgi:hypothetical protein
VIAEFQRVYFDSNIWIKEGWPQLSSNLESFLHLAERFGVAVFLPEPVEQELEAHWRRKLHEKLDKTTASIQAVQNLTSEISAKPGTWTPPDLNSLLVAYRERVRLLKDRWKLGQAAQTCRPLSELYLMAIHYESPFKDDREGAGFQDAVIYLSSIDDLKRNQGQIGAFVSLDREFHDKSIDELAAKAEVRLKVYKSLQEVVDVLVAYLAQDLRRQWEEDRGRAKVALQNMLPAVQQFIDRNFQISDWDLLWLDAVTMSVSAVEVSDIAEVQVPFPWDREPGKRFNISSEIKVRIRAVVKRLGYSMFPAPKVFKVGEEGRTPESNPYLQATPGPEVEERMTECTINLEAKAVAVDREYQEIQLLSINLKR